LRWIGGRVLRLELPKRVFHFKKILFINLVVSKFWLLFIKKTNIAPVHSLGRLEWQEFAKVFTDESFRRIKIFNL